MEQSHELIYAQSGEPFRGKQAAEAAMARKALSPDDYKVIPLDTGGFVISRMTPLVSRNAEHKEDVTPVVKEKVASETPREKYFEVRFSAKSNPIDSDDVVLAVQGETLVIQREKNIVLPERFLECADHTRYPKFTQEPGKDRKTGSMIMTFPYQRIREATEEEYLQQKTSGTKKVKRDIERYGFDLEPGDID